MKLEYVSTKHQVADLFTKSLYVKDFRRLREVLMGYKPMNEMIKLNMKDEVKTLGSFEAVIASLGYNRDEESDLQYQGKSVANCQEGYRSFWNTVLDIDEIEIPGY